MKDRSIEYRIKGDSANLSAALSQSERRVARFGSKTIRTFKKIGETINTVSDRYLTRFNSLLGGAAMVMAGKGVIELDARLARLKMQAGLTDREFVGLKEKIFNLAEATHQNPGALLDGVEAIVERTGDFEFAITSLEDMGRMASATGAEMGAIGATASNLMDKAKISQKELTSVFDILTVQGKHGAFTLEHMSRMMERLLTAGGRMNVQGKEGVRVFGAWMQVAKKGGTAEIATNAIETAIAEMLDPRKHKMILKLTGFNVIDTEASKKAGVTVMKDLETVIKGIVSGAKGDESILGQIFGQVSIKSITRISDVFRRTGGFSEFDKFIQMGGDGATVMEDFAFWSEQTAAKIEDLSTQLTRFANENLAGPIELLNDALSVLNDHPVLTSGALYGLLGLGGVAMTSKAVRGVGGIGRGVADLLLGKRGEGGAGGIGSMASLGAPMPVYVVNRHLSMLPGKGGWLEGAAGSGKKSGGLVSALLSARTAGVARLAGLGGIGSTLASGVGSVGMGTLVGGSAAALAGGWAIGRGISHIPTGDGKNVQDRLEGLIDMLVDGAGRKKAAEQRASYERWKRVHAAPVVNNTLNVGIDGAGRVVAESDNSGKTTINAGFF